MPPQYTDSNMNAEPVEQTGKKRLESIAFYVLLATIVLAPLAFLPTPYIALDAVKTTLIALGVLISVILQGIVIYREGRFALPSQGLRWLGVLVVISLIVSALISGHTGKSFFGQGFEINTVSFLVVMLLACLSAFMLIRKVVERTVIIYVGITASFLILVLLHALRFAIGQSFMTLGVLSSLVTTLVGSWYDLAAYALVIAIVALSAVTFLPLSRVMKMVYAGLLILSLFVAYTINSSVVWLVAFIVFVGYAIYMTLISPQLSGNRVFSLFKRLAWIPIVIALIAGIFSWKGVPLAKPLINGLGAEYTALSLPWQISLDITAGAIKQNPFFGVGPNRFSQAYISYRPLAINSTNAWSTEFNYAFGLLPTFVATQGLLGLLAWSLLIVFLGISVVRSLRHLPEDPHGRFLVVSSSAITVFLWGMMILSVPSHTMVLYAFIAAAITLGISAQRGVGSPALLVNIRSRIFSIAIIICIVVGGVWVVYYIKDATALAYFGSGAKALSVRNDTETADRYFARAYDLNPSDVYLQARVETGIVKANQLISSVTQTTPASTSQAVIGQVVDTVNTAVSYAQQAVAYDPTNYYNYLSEARVSELATNVRMDKAYDNAVNAYTRSIQLNPLNPSLYLNLARLQASQNKLDDALRTLGAALQVKNDYLDAIFLLSQVSAAQGNLKDAITAAQVATQISPENPLLFFQLGLLHYNNKGYAEATQALESAVKLQADYANAQYFLGLSYVRLGRTNDAIDQFTQLSETNPDNEEIVLILSNLKAGKSPFADAKPPVTPNPEKRSSLPVKQKQK